MRMQNLQNKMSNYSKMIGGFMISCSQNDLFHFVFDEFLDNYENCSRHGYFMEDVFRNKDPGCN